MEISGVHIADGLRLLVPESGADATLFHELGSDEWCATRVKRSTITGSFDEGDLTTKKPVKCAHLEGSIKRGAWIPREDKP